MGNRELFQKVKELNLPLGKYALFGSAPMGIRGLKECNDIDVLVTQDIWNVYRNKSDWEIEELSDGREMLTNKEKDIELGADWAPGSWNVNKLIQDAEIIDGLPFVRLESVLEWKKLMRREKDLKDIETIEKFLREQSK